MKEREHIIKLLGRAKRAAEKDDIVTLKELSDQTTHASTIHQDEDNIAVAIIIYALSKIIEKGRCYYKQDYERKVGDYIKFIDKSISYLKKGDDKGFQNQVGSIIKSKKDSGETKKYIQAIFRKARINKASRIYEHGISREKTAKLLGISLWELAEYTGQTHIADYELGKTKDVKMRIKVAMEMFA